MGKNKMLTEKERYAQGTKLISALKELLGAKNIGTVRKASIKMEVNEPIEVELKIWL